MANEKEKSNPANAPLQLPKGYKPMSGATLRLEVPERSGWHRHWFRGTQNRLARAQQAGYNFVDPDDVDVNNFDLAGDSKSAGSTDLGTRISVTSGDGNEDGSPSRMYLMECPEAIFKYAQGLLMDINDSTAAALRGGLVGSGGSGENSADISSRYKKVGPVPDLFTSK